MKKVLFISNRTSFSGGEVVLLRLISSDRQITPVIAAPQGELIERLKELNVKVYQLNEISQLDRGKNKFWLMKALQNAIRGQLHLRRIIKQESPDIVHANALGAAIYSFLPSFIARKPFIWTSHNIYSPRSINAVAIRVLGLFSTKIIAVSQSVRRNLTSIGITKNKSVVIYNGLDLPSPVQHSDQSLIRKFDLPKNSIVISLIASITPWKGQELLIDAAAGLVNDYPNTAFLLIGVVEDPDYQDRLSEKVKNLNLSKYVFFPGFVKDIASVYHHVDVVVNASIEPEPFGTTIYEAMAHKLITIGSDIGGTPEIIEDGKTGFLFKAGDSEELSNKLSYVLSRFDKLDPVRISARRSVAERFDIHLMVENYNKLYESI